MKNPFKKLLSLKEPVTNPYVPQQAGRREWNDRYMNLSYAIRNWQLAFLSVAIALILSLLLIAKLISENRIVPFVVETNKGIPISIEKLDALKSRDPMLVNFALNEFIINTRSVVSDHAAQKRILEKAYAYSADDALNFLRDYFEKNNPFEGAGERGVSVSIVSSMPVSPNTWQIIWDETKKEADGVASNHRYMANIEFKWGKVEPKFLMDNPFGIYVTHLSWVPIFENKN